MSKVAAHMRRARITTVKMHVSRKTRFDWFAAIVREVVFTAQLRLCFCPVLCTAWARLPLKTMTRDRNPSSWWPETWNNPWTLAYAGVQAVLTDGVHFNQTGPNPTDRRKKGSKHHVITDANGTPLACTLTGANRHDITQLIPLVNAIPAILGKPGRPLQRSEGLCADRSNHSEMHGILLWKKGIEPHIAQRGEPHGSGLGRVRWVVERTISWLHQFRRLRVRFKRRADIHKPFVALGCAMICWNTLKTEFC